MIGDDMEVMAAGFAEQGEAAEVASRLHDAFELAPEDLSLDQLGGSGELENGPVVVGLTVVLAGRFHRRCIPVVADVVEHHGGVVLTTIAAARAR